MAQRFDVAQTFSGTGDNVRFRIQPNLQTGTIFFYGGQVEELSHPTSLIYTTGATSTRNADVCNNSGSAQDFNSEEGVLYAELASLAEYVGGSKNFAISDGTNNNVIKFSFKNTSNQIGVNIKSNGTAQVSQTYNITVSNFFKMAIKYKANDCALWVNGTEVATDTSATNAFSFKYFTI